MTAGLRQVPRWPSRRRSAGERVVVPPDPRAALDGPLDPSLQSIRAALAGHRNRLWLRRIVRRTWIALAAIAIAEAVLWTMARFIPIEAAPVVAAAIPIVVALILVVAIVRARPSLGEAAIAVDVEGGLGDRVSSAMELAVAYPALTLFCIVVTANHYWIDGLAGLACLGLGYLVARTATRWWESRRGVAAIA